MSNKFPVLSVKKCIRTLEAFGFYVAPRKSSHIRMTNGLRACTLPNHKEVRMGTLFNTLRQAGISRKEFLAAYYKKKKRAP